MFALATHSQPPPASQNSSKFTSNWTQLCGEGYTHISITVQNFHLHCFSVTPASVPQLKPIKRKL